MGKASKFNIGRMKIVWIFFWCGHEKMLKIDFFHKTLIPRNLLKEKNIRARSMWNLTSWRFRKCGTYWACEVLNGSYRPSKMDESEKTGPSPKIRGVKTQSRLMSWYESCKWVKVKVVKWCQKKWNEHNLMYICHKQCEIMHNIQRNSSNGQFHCFHYVR